MPSILKKTEIDNEMLKIKLVKANNKIQALTLKNEENEKKTLKIRTENYWLKLRVDVLEDILSRRSNQLWSDKFNFNLWL